MRRFKLVQTCGACPEQYDVYFEDRKVGYLRLRHGYFRAEYRGIEVFGIGTRGDGIFEDGERTKLLNKACQAIDQAMNEDVDQTPLYDVEEPEEE